VSILEVFGMAKHLKGQRKWQCLANLHSTKRGIEMQDIEF
jgi:hypothetical protein